MLLLLLLLNASPTRCEVDFSLWGSRADPAESAFPLNLSPKCSVVDFSESGCETNHVSVAHTARVREGTDLERGGSLVGEALAAGVGHDDDDKVVVVVGW